jgi:hypothetical protein
MFAYVTNGTIQAVGKLPVAARRLDTGQWVLGLRDAVAELQRACGWFAVVDAPRPADTDTSTHDRSIELVHGLPTVVWTEREWTDAEVAARREVEAPDMTTVLAAKLVAADNESPQPWQQPTGAHDAYLPGAIVLDGVGGDRHRNTLTVPNVWSLDVYGWENVDATTPTDPQPWKQPLGAQDAYQIGDRATHNGQTWTSTAANNVWVPGQFGWVAD